MIKKLWQKIFTPEKQAQPEEQLQILDRDSHHISRKLISKNALKVLHRLNDAGYEAYLVGGGVRDILLGLRPKDFDIATSATPEQISQQFKNCRLIGRRFRLAHIMFGREVIEVATFRAGHETSSKNSKTSEQGMLLRDNVYGSLEDDAFRRDFTVNALYYSASDETVKDHVNGLRDLELRQLKLIGNPEERYREDPVRILRAIRLACKLELKIEQETAKPIAELSHLLSHVSSARLWDESHKLFLNGHALNTWQMLVEQNVAQHLFAETLKELNKPNKQNFQLFLEAAFNNTDKRIAQQKPVTPAFLFAVLMWEPVETLKQKLISKGLAPYDASQKAATQILEKQRQSIAIPKRFSIVIREIWGLQFRFTNRRAKSVFSLLENPRFRAAYDFLFLRAKGDPSLTELADWWTHIQSVSPEKQKQMIKQVNPNSGKRFQRKRKPKSNRQRQRVPNEKR